MARASRPQAGQLATWLRISSISAGSSALQHKAADQLTVALAAAHRPTSISSRISRRVRRAYEVRLLTVPSGIPLCSAISRMLSPP